MFLKITSAFKLNNFKKENTVALAFAIIAAVCLLTGYFQYPALYPADYGEYDYYLRDCSLTWTQEDLARGNLYYTRSLSHYDYTHFSWMKLLSPSAGYSTVYAVALVRLFTAPFGLPFSCDLLAAVWSAVLCFAVYWITKSLIQLLRHGWWIFPLMLCLLFTDGNVTAMLRGLYPQGGMLCCGLLYMGALLNAETRRRGGQGQRLITLAALSVLFLKSEASMLLFLPFVALIFLYYFWVHTHRAPAKAMYMAASLVILVTGSVAAATSAFGNTDYFSNDSEYQSVFNVMLPASDNAEELLKDLGLDKSYLPDVGRSYYEDASLFAHPPTDEMEAEKLFSALSRSKILAAYLRRPELLFRVVSGIPASLKGYTSNRNLPLEPPEEYSVTRTGDGLLAYIRLMLPYSWKAFALCCAALIPALVILGVKKKRAVPWILTALVVGAVLYLPACVMLNGYGSASQYALFQVLLMDGMLALALTGIYNFSFLVSAWMTKYAKEPIPKEPVTANVEALSGEGRKNRFSFFADAWKIIANSRVRTTVCIASIALAMILITLLKPNHAGCVNNGDFGRMMESIDLIWSGDIYYDVDAQYLHWVIEDYEWTQPFNWKKLTPLSPSYSLYAFASISRLFTDAMGMSMNTYVLEWVMAVITIGCIILLTYDLFKVLNRHTLPIGLLLCMMFCSETSLTWYNGLFGEGSLLLGLLMSVTCAVHLAVLPKHMKWFQWGWFLALAYSLYILSTAKAQTLLAAPFSIVLLCALMWYHRPYRYDLQAAQGIILLVLCGSLALSSLSVYRSDRTQDSSSQRHTMWQAYFYGIFMISDDPIADMEELGIDTRMAADIGKFVDFTPEAEYVYFPLSDEAKAAFTDHVSTMKIILWYLRHPTKMIYMLNHAAEVSRELYTDFRAYKGQDYWDWFNRDAVDGLGLWQYWRQALAPYTFWGYAIFYGVYLWLLLRGIFSKKAGLNDRGKMLCWTLIFIMMTGVLQYPLSVLGNGFADNQKQMFCFSTCHDMLLCSALPAFRLLIRLPAGAEITRAAGKPRMKKTGGKRPLNAARSTDDFSLYPLRGSLLPFWLPHCNYQKKSI